MDSGVPSARLSRARARLTRPRRSSTACTVLLARIDIAGQPPHDELADLPGAPVRLVALGPMISGSSSGMRANVHETDSFHRPKSNGG
jgi:hypothetical protein